jgi:hypothetical protein
MGEPFISQADSPISFTSLFRQHPLYIWFFVRMDRVMSTSSVPLSCFSLDEKPYATSISKSTLHIGNFCLS